MRGKQAQNNKAGGRVSPPRASSSNNKKGERSISPTSEMHFASSAFLKSPDPSKLPVPDFDEDDDMLEVNKSLFSPTSTASSSPSARTGTTTPSPTPSLMSSEIKNAKTDTLKLFLNIRPAAQVVSH